MGVRARAAASPQGLDLSETGCLQLPLAWLGLPPQKEAFSSLIRQGVMETAGVSRARMAPRGPFFRRWAFEDRLVGNPAKDR
jgi:hypothetical protein